MSVFPNPKAGALRLFCGLLTLGLLTLGLLGLACGTGEAERPEDPPEDPPNVLFIAVDDLRPELGCYGEGHMVTPHLDRFASEGRLFERHYVQVPTCGASRYALLTGNRPAGPEFLSNEALREQLPREEGARPESFVHLFRRNGYRTVSLGKVSHYPDGRVYAYDGTGTGAPEMPFSWDERWGPTGKWGTAWNAFFGYADGTNRNQDRGRLPAYEHAAVADTAYPDGLIAEQAMLKLRELAGQPFFLGVGFFKPHLPFTAPQQYWDLYDPEQIPLSPNPGPPEGTHPNSLHAGGELFGSYGHPVEGGKGVRIDDGYARTLRHAYFASVS
jgi:arylsulfatase A-like enzyme